MAELQGAVLAGAALVFMFATIWANVLVIVERRDHARQRKEWTEERARLLDRLMARDYETFRAYSPEPRDEKLRPILNDLDEARIEAEQNGIPMDLDESDKAFIAELQAGR